MNDKMGLNATWSMAVGGMVGGGIFSVLGLIIKTAGNFAWVSFLISGLIALSTAISYSTLTINFKQGGGAFEYIKDVSHKSAAGGLSWLLIMGYILTISVYSFTFGHYLSYVFSIESTLLSRVFAAIVVITFISINLKGVGESSKVEIFTVWVKLLILLIIASFGFKHFDINKYIVAHEGNDFFNILIGSASIFMAYEGFQLITYDYEDIHRPEKTIHKAEILAVLTVMILYVIVTIGISLLVDKSIIIDKQEVVIAIAGKSTLGTFGLILATVAALFSTGSAINSTLFSTARLAEKVSKDNEMPSFMKHKNKNKIPDRAIILIGGLGGALAFFGSLERLVESASFIFLITFFIVNYICFNKIKKKRKISFIGMVGTGLSAIVLLIKFLINDLLVLIFLLSFIIIVTLVRKLILNEKSW